MRIKFVEISNFRKLKSTHIDVDKQTTLFVGANNSGKTSAMIALRFFLVSPNRLALRDVTIANWTKIDALGNAWESQLEDEVDLNGLLPCLDVWLDVSLSEIRHVVHMLPTLEWNGGLLGIRLKYQFESIEKLKAEYLRQRAAALAAQAPGGKAGKLRIRPTCLTDFLERSMRDYLVLESFALDPAAHTPPVKGLATPQVLPDSALPLEKNPFKDLIKIHEIAAQRDFADAGDRGPNFDDAPETSSSRFKRRLADQLRSYYDRHLDPMKTPSAEDYDALGAIQTAEETFDDRLKVGFSAAFAELEDLGYPGISNPKLRISTQLRATDGLKHGSAVQYQVADPTGDGLRTLRLPEDYSGLGYQNLIAMVFMLMSYRDEWMRVGKATITTERATSEQIPPLHLVLVEEPEAHLHAQVQQVFIKKAYQLLRRHADLGDNETFSTQLVVSTHSSHVAHEADFGSLRYFRRHAAVSAAETPTTTVANLSYVFGQGDDTQRFVRRYLKSTHCDLFFADGIVFVEGQAERILIPHFIRHQFNLLASCYVTVLDLGGSHAHRFKQLVDELGLTTLIIADLDATMETRVATKGGGEAVRWKATKPKRGVGQMTANPVLKEWHPLKENIDELIALKPGEHECASNGDYSLYVAFQKPLSPPPGEGGSGEVIPRTFEDALILENLDIIAEVSGSRTSEKIRAIVESGLSGEELADELFELLKTAEKAAFALDCLMWKDAKSISPPRYIRDGLDWFQRAVCKKVAEAETPVGNET